MTLLFGLLVPPLLWPPLAPLLSIPIFLHRFGRPFTNNSIYTNINKVSALLFQRLHDFHLCWLIDIQDWNHQLLMINQKI